MKSFYKHLRQESPTPEGYRPAGRLTLERAFAVYQEGYIARLTSALGDTFEVIWRVLGDDLFLNLARDFILKNPSESYNLSDYSQGFIPYLEGHFTSEEFPFLANLAKIAWCHKEIFNTAPEIGLSDKELLVLLGQATACAGMIRTFQFIKSEYGVFDLWQAAMTSYSELPPTWNQPQAVLLYQKDSQVFVKQVSLPIYEVLESIRDGHDILVACEALSEEDLSFLFHFFAENRILTSSR